MDEVNISDLQRAIESRHHCEARFNKTVSVSIYDKFKSQWEGTVHVFAISGHLLTNTCYAWSSPIEGSEKRRIYTMLSVPPVNSAAAAVRASSFADNKRAK